MSAEYGSIYEYIRGPLKTAHYELWALKAVIGRSIPDILVAGAATSDILSRNFDGMNSQRLHRVLRFLSSLGYFNLDSETREFSLTEKGLELVSSNPLGAHSELISMGSDEVTYFLPDILTEQNTSSAFALKYGMSHWDFLGKNPDKSQIFDRKMESILQHDLPFLLDTIDRSQWSYIFDIGGGNGTLARELKRKNPTVFFTVFDLPRVISAVEPNLRTEGVHIFQGDFFIEDEIPVFPSRSCLILSRVLHDWSDEKSKRILNNLKNNADQDTTLIVIEMIAYETSLTRNVVTRDFTMMLLYGDARERTHKEFEDLLTSSGWKIKRIISSSNETTILEASLI